MTKLLWIIGIIAVIVGGYKIWEIWEQYDKDKDLAAEEARKREVKGEMLPGLPYEIPNIQDSLATAQKGGATTLANWLKTYGSKVQDPRKAWIELDYMEDIAHEDPNEARKIFAMVQSRITTNSPVWPRIEKLKSTFGN